MAFRGLFVSLVHTVLHSNDAEKQKLFFVTYPQYGTPTDLLSTVQESLRAAETQDNGPACMKLVGTFLLRWIENCPEDFEMDKKLGEDLLGFAREKLSPSMTNHIKLKYLRCVTGQTMRVSKNDVASVSTPFSSVRPKDIACYLTLIDWRYFTAIRATELFDNAWQKPNKNEVAPNISALAQRFNTLSLWLADWILESYARNGHTAVVEKIIEVLKELFKINNFSSGMAVLSAFNNSSVQRLRNLWTAVRKEHRDALNHFELFMGMTDNFKNYRRHLKKLQISSADGLRTNNRKTPVIPFLALYLRDITFIRDGNSDTKGHQLNMEKIELQGRQILQLQEWQKTPYTFNFTCDEAYCKFFEQLVAPKEDHLFEKSLKLQPGTLENVFSVAPRMEPSSIHKDDEDTISLNLDTDLKASDKLLLNTEYYEVLTEDISVSEAEDMLRDAGVDNMIDFELDKVQSMLVPSSTSSPMRSLDFSIQYEQELSKSDSGVLCAVQSLDTFRPRSTSAITQCEPNPDINTWRSFEVADWLRRAYLSKHVAAFVDANIDGPRLVLADHKLLSSLGISNFKDRKMVLTLVEKLKVDHGIPVAARISTDSSDVLTAPKTVVEDHDVISDTTTESLTDSTSSVKSRTSGNKKERTSSRKHSVSEENDQQVDGDKKSKTKKKGSKKGSKRGSLIEVERVVLAETEPATPIVIPPPSVAPARRPSLLFRNHSKSFPAAEVAQAAEVIPVVVDVGSLGGATLVVCCEDEKWDGGKLGPFSYDKLVRLIVDKHEHIFRSTTEVGIVCAGLKKSSISIKSDKDLRQVKILAKERNEKIVVFTVSRRR